MPCDCKVCQDCEGSGRFTVGFDMMGWAETELCECCGGSGIEEECDFCVDSYEEQRSQQTYD